MSTHPNLRILIGAFQDAVSRATLLFQKHRGFSDISQWRSHKMQQTGILDYSGVYRYYFHGVGCAFHFENGETIDWDWGHEGRNDGFDLWRLRIFWEDRPALKELFPDYPSLEAAFKEAAANGEIVSPWRDSYDSLFYLPEDLSSEKAEQGAAANP